MKKIISIGLILIIGIGSTFAQNSRHVIFFTDKNNSPFSISNPLSFLSQRAIDRRNNQGISITSQDLPVNPSYVSGVAATGATILNRSKWWNSVTVEVTGPAMLNDILALPYVANENNVGRYSVNGNPTSDKLRVDRINVTAPVTSPRTSVYNYGNSLNQVAMLKGDLMHQAGYTGQGVIIAVLDAGFSIANNIGAFDSLFINNRILSTWDFVDNESDVYDDDAHGTMVLSTMGGNLPGELIGTAPDASYILLRSENAPAEAIIEEYNWASAAEYADSAGADVINSSLGYTVFDDPSQNHTYADLDGNTTPITIAADIVASKGIVVCNSAGNEGNSPWFRLSAPSDADNILGIGAVDATGLNVGFSGKGPSADGRVKPDVCAQGFGTYVADPWSGSGTFAGSGTSFSSPLMAGMVATLKQCHPNATAAQIVNAVRLSASQYSNPDSLLGYGIPDFPMACMLLSGLSPELPFSGDVLTIDGNPFSEVLELDYYSIKAQKITIILSDILGKVQFTRDGQVTGFTKTRFAIPATFAQGTYLVQIISDSGRITKKVVHY